MKMLLLGLAMVSSLGAEAAGLTCTYQQEPCNENGDHYLCVYYGWAYGEFCSPTGSDRRMNRGWQQSCDDCYSQPRPSEFCRQQCGCSAAFCGQW